MNWPSATRTIWINRGHFILEVTDNLCTSNISNWVVRSYENGNNKIHTYKKHSFVCFKFLLTSYLFPPKSTLNRELLRQFHQKGGGGGGRWRIAEKLWKYSANIGNNIQGGWRMTWTFWVGWRLRLNISDKCGSF